MSEQTLTSPSLGPRTSPRILDYYCFFVLSIDYFTGTRRQVGADSAAGGGQGGRDLFSAKQAQQLQQQIQHTLQLLLQM